MKKVRVTKSVGQEILASLSELETALEENETIAKQFTIRCLSLDLKATARGSQQLKATRQSGQPTADERKAAKIRQGRREEE